jgi:hypothetical protein
MKTPNYHCFLHLHGKLWIRSLDNTVTLGGVVYRLTFDGQELVVKYDGGEIRGEYHSIVQRMFDKFKDELPLVKV